MLFPKLYGLPSNGKKIKEWSVEVEQKNNSVYIKRIHGFQNCKMQETLKEIKVGKNIGKKNETTPLQQAENEAQSLWNKQKESGYKENIKDLTEDKTKVLPMLAFDFNKRGKDIEFPCFIQPKLDGIRLLVQVTDSGIKCISRTGKLFENLKHIENEIRKLNLENDIYLDGELFTFSIPFEEISGLCRKQEKVPEVDILQFHIFDIFKMKNIDEPFSKRLCNLNEIQNTITNKKLTKIVVVKTTLCHDKNEMIQQHQEYMIESYEGVILRNKNGAYQPGYRNKNLQKYKEFTDEEFEIIGAESGVGLEQDCAIFTCVNTNGDKFSVRPRGSRELRKEYLKDIENIKGKYLTVRYQNLSESGIVRFGVGIAIRDYE
jgi:ATP-dependent DNA ligase